LPLSARTGDMRSRGPAMAADPKRAGLLSIIAALLTPS
jgi:hypothetical protein